MADDGISIYLCIGYHGNSVDLNVMKYYCLLLSFLWGFVFFVSGHYGVVDYSENAQIKFRVWLQKKYGTIDKLNDTWGTSFWSETYQNFEQVRLPNQQEVPEKPNPHAMLDRKSTRLNSSHNA